jgi:diphthamide biosynthesis protein 2
MIDGKVKIFTLFIHYLTKYQEFLRPIVTPYELEIALQAEQSWTGRYVLDFEKLLAEHASRTDGV